MAARRRSASDEEPTGGEPPIRHIQFHRRSHVLGIPGTSDVVSVGEHVERIEPQSLGGVAGFAVMPRKGSPVFVPGSAVLAVGLADG